MKRPVWLLVAPLIALFALPAFADQQFIVRTRDGRTAIDQACARLGCRVVRALDGSGPSNRVFLVAISDYTRTDDFLEDLEEQEGVDEVERVQPAALPEAEPEVEMEVQQSTSAVLKGLTDRLAVKYFGDTVWNGYVAQPAAKIVRIAETHKSFSLGGTGIVAIIDTGIDPNHPALKQWIASGYDFTRNVSGVPSELADLSVPIVTNQSTVAVLNQSTVAVLNQSTVAVLDDRQHAAFGHGTMVAGIIHLVAPKAKLMALKVFRADGTGKTSDVARAIYYAVDNGAKVINMSFSLGEFSPEIMRAVNYAARKGVVCVASVGNEGKDVLVFPASLGNAIGVGSTTNEDTRASFSNYSADVVWVAAPGEGVITAFPGSTYAAAWGTSFSAAIVSGAVALLVEVEAKTNAAQAADALSHAKSVSGELGFGRLDLYEAVLAHRKALGLQ